MKKYKYFLILVILFFYTTFFACTKKRVCKKMPKISGDIVEEYNFNNSVCYNPEIDFKENLDYINSINGKYFFYNDSIFDIYLKIIKDTINYSPSKCVKPKIDFSKHSLVGFLVSNQFIKVCDIHQKVEIDKQKKNVNYTIYNCAPSSYCRLETNDYKWWVLIPKVDSTYKINYIYEEL